MSAEKRALRRFLFIYLFSTLLIIGVGECFYYKLASNNLLTQKRTYLKQTLKEFLNLNPFIFRAVKFGELQIPKGAKMIVYLNGRVVFSNTKPLEIKESYVEKKRWGEIKIIATQSFPYEKLRKVVYSLVVFNIFMLVFLVVTAYFLGKLFLRPMRESIEHLEDFIRDSTHEMNTPISVIKTNVEMLKIKGVKDKEFDRIQAALDRLEKIFENLKFLKLKKELKKIVSINLEEFIKERLQLFKTVIEKKRLNVKINKERVTLHIDKEDLTRLIDNLLSNAFKFAPNDSEISINVKNDSFEISNMGHIKEIATVTDKYVRQNDSEGGFGLGLYIVKKICEYYGYEFSIENKKNRVFVRVRFKKFKNG